MNTWTSPQPPETPAPVDQSGLLLYEPYYGLSEKPFSLSTDPRFLYRSESHTPVFQDVLAGIRRREGLVVLSGEIGTGKTTLCRSVLGALDRKTFSAFVPDPFVTREDLLKILLIEFGVVSVDDLMRGQLQGASRAELSYPLYEFLRSLEPLDGFAVVLLDEAQSLPVPLLEEIRILSDLEGARKLLQVVLIGQPELTTALRLPHMRQLQQRVTTHCELQPLTREGVQGYAAHRLTVAGAAADRLHFTGDALALVFEASGGVPRVVNRLCDRALQRGHQARSATIGSDLVGGAIDDLQLIVSMPTRIGPVLVPAPAPALPLAAVLALAAAADSAVPLASEFPAEPVVAADQVALPLAAEPGVAVHTTSEAESTVGSDDLRALLALLPAIPSSPSPGLVPPPSEPARVDRRRPARPRHVEAPRTSRMRGVVAASLILLGAMSGTTLAFYWVWAGPLLTEAVVMPVVKRPPARIGAPLPAVLPPAVDFGSDVFEPPPASGNGEADDRAPSAPVAAGPAQDIWVVQVAALDDYARAAEVVRQLNARGLTAFTNASTMRSGATLYLVLVGPYASRAAAAGGLESVTRVPGMGQPILQPVPPATAVLR